MTSSYSSISLNQLQVKIQKAAPDYELGSFTAGSMKLRQVDRFARGMVLELRTSLLGAQVLADKQEFFIEYPASWWQHFKRDHLPGWFKRRWPVRTQKAAGAVEFKRYDTYPLANVPVPPDEFGYPVRVEIMNFDHLSEGVISMTPGPPRMKYAKRHELVSHVFEEVRDKFASSTNAGSYGPSPRASIEIIFDTLERFGVNVNQLADVTAFDSPRPEKERP